MAGGSEQHTGEQFCRSIQLRMDFHAHSQFPFMPRGLFALFALFFLGFQGLGFLFELLAQRDAVFWCGLPRAVYDGRKMLVMWTNEQWTMDRTTEYADSAAAGPWPGHGEVVEVMAVGRCRSNRMRNRESMTLLGDLPIAMTGFYTLNNEKE